MSREGSWEKSQEVGREEKVGVDGRVGRGLREG